MPRPPRDLARPTRGPRGDPPHRPPGRRGDRPSARLGSPSHAPSAAAARTGLRVAADSLLDLFDTPLLAEAGLVEARVVRKAVRGAAAGEPLPLDGLADLVSLELWLRRLLARRGTCWTGTPARARAVPAGVSRRVPAGPAGSPGAAVRRLV
ncbi:hypothetical protein GCM10020256_40810 [Streptomyces thermocoprophilus]